MLMGAHGEEEWSSFQTHTARSLPESPTRASPEKECPKSPWWVQPAHPSAGLELSRVCHQYLEDQVVHSPGAVMIGVLNPGKMASRCVANILVPQVDLTPTDFHHQMAMRRLLFPISVLWVGDLCVQLVPHTPRGREFCH